MNENGSFKMKMRVLAISVKTPLRDHDPNPSPEAKSNVLARGPGPQKHEKWSKTRFRGSILNGFGSLFVQNEGFGVGLSGPTADLASIWADLDLGGYPELLKKDPKTTKKGSETSIFLTQKLDFGTYRDQSK